MNGEKITLIVMVVVGMLFWLGTIVHRGLDWPIIVLSAVLVAWSVYHLMRMHDEGQ